MNNVHVLQDLREKVLDLYSEIGRVHRILEPKQRLGIICYHLRLCFLAWFTGAIMAEVGATESQRSHQNILVAYEQRLQQASNDMERERILQLTTHCPEGRRFLLQDANVSRIFGQKAEA